VYICTYSSHYRDIGQAKEILKNLTVLNVECHGSLFACHCGHTCHRFASSCLDTVLTLLSWLIGLYGGNGRILGLKETNFDIYVLFVRFILFIKSLERNHQKVIRICPLTMPNKSGPGDLVQRSQLGGVCMTGGDSIERSLMVRVAQFSDD
jgi:hypothetical protein